MGKGDQRSKRGKIRAGSHGNTRLKHKNMNKDKKGQAVTKKSPKRGK